MIQQARQALHNGKPEPKPLAPVTLRVFELIKLPKNFRVALGWNAPAGIPHLDTDGIAPATATEHDAAPVGVTNRVGQQVADDPAEQGWVADDVHASLHYRQRNPLLARDWRVFEPDPIEHHGQRNGRHDRLYDPGIQA